MSEYAEFVKRLLNSHGINRTGKHKCFRCEQSGHGKGKQNLSVFQGDDGGIGARCHRQDCDLSDFIKSEWEMAKQRENSTKSYKPSKDTGAARNVQKTSTSGQNSAMFWEGIGELTPEAVAYFTGRGISKETLNEWGVKSVNGWIAFRFFRDGKVVNDKYRMMAEKKMSQSKGGMATSYGYDGALGHDTIIMVEGEIDALTLAECGFDGVVSCPSGANMNTDFIDNDEKLFGQAKKIVLAMDSDEVGLKWREMIAEKLGKHRCSYVVWPEGCKDANDALVNLGKDAVVKSVNAAIDYPISHVLTVDDLVKDAFDFINGRRNADYIPTGLNILDDAFKIVRQRLYLITGHPNAGKGEFFNFVFTETMRHGAVWAVYSPESDYPMMLSSIVRKHGLYSRDDAKIAGNFARASAEVKRKIFFLQQGEDKNYIEDLLLRVKFLVERHGVNCVILDPWNECDHNRKKGEREDEYITRILAFIKRFAKINNVAMFIVAHPAKPAKDKITQNNPPTLYEISGGAAFNSKADFGIVLHRYPDDPDKKYITELHVRKVRNNIIEGNRGKVVKLKWSAETSSFSPVGFYDSIKTAKDKFN